MSSAHYPGAIIDFWPAGELFPTQTTLTDQVSYRSPYYTIQDQFASSAGTASTQAPFRWPRYPRYTKVARCALVVLLNHHQYNAWWLDSRPDSVQASRSEQLILPAKCGACIQYGKRAVNDRSLIDTGRGTTVNTTITPYPVLVSFPHLVTFHHRIDS